MLDVAGFVVVLSAFFRDFVALCATAVDLCAGLFADVSARLAGAADVAEAAGAAGVVAFDDFTAVEARRERACEDGFACMLSRDAPAAGLAAGAVVCWASTGVVDSVAAAATIRMLRDHMTTSDHCEYRRSR